MKKISKLFKYVFAIVCMVCATVNANAAVTMGKSVPLTQQDILMYDNNTAIKTGATYKTVFIDGTEYNAYCLNHEKEAAPNGTTLNLGSLSSGQSSYTNAFVYILEHAPLKSVVGSFDKSAYSKYYIGQLAIWGIQYDATGGVEGLNLNTLNPTTDNTRYVKSEAIKLYKEALNHNGKQVYNISVKKSSDFKLSGDYYVAEFTVTGEGFSNYNVTATGAPSGSQFVVSGNVSNGKGIAKGKNFSVRVPASAVVSSANGITVNVTVNATATGKELLVYRSALAGYQDVAIPKPKNISLSASASASKKVNTVPISKQDATNGKELPGAHLKLTTSDGKLIEEWDSTTTPHQVKLAKGTYALEETIAPAGYKKSTTKVTFEVNENGEVASPVVMKNSPIRNYSISKKDVTTQEELPGAEIILKNSLGEEIDKWTSTETPHVVTDLAPGTYTLTEIRAPKGFQKAEESVTFEIDANGVVNKPLVMYNYPETSIKISKQDVTTKKELPGAKLIIKDADGNVVDEWISKSTPHYVSLAKGKYTLIEIRPPEGFELSEEVKEFEVGEDGVEKTVVMTNSPIPKTGDMNVTLITVGLVATALLVGFSIFKLNKQQEA